MAAATPTAPARAPAAAAAAAAGAPVRPAREGPCTLLRNIKGKREVVETISFASWDEGREYAAQSIACRLLAEFRSGATDKPMSCMGSRTFAEELALFKLYFAEQSASGAYWRKSFFLRRPVSKDDYENLFRLSDCLSQSTEELMDSRVFRTAAEALAAPGAPKLPADAFYTKPERDDDEESYDSDEDDGLDKSEKEERAPSPKRACK